LSRGEFLEMVVRVAHLKSKKATQLDRSGKSSSAAPWQRLKDKALQAGENDESALKPPPADSKETLPADESREKSKDSERASRHPDSSPMLSTSQKKSEKKVQQSQDKGEDKEDSKPRTAP